MNMKIVVFIAIAIFALAEARHFSQQTRHRNYEVEDDDSADDILDSLAGRQPHPASRRALSHKQARVFPGAIAIKKLVLLKFKKIVPISLILLKSSNDNEAELVPVYPTSEIPSDVQFIPTPNGISGHKDVQAIAIPSELHQQLEAHGLANIENIEALLNQAADVPTEDESSVAMVSSMNVDEPLNVSETDVTQMLEGVVAKDDKKPMTPMAPLTTAALPSNLRRIAADDHIRPVTSGLRAAQQTTVEEIPLFLYSAKDNPVLHNNARIAGLRLATSNNTPRRRFIV